MSDDLDVATGKKLFDWLKSLTPDQRSLPLAMTGHYGEYLKVELPEISTVRGGVLGDKAKFQAIVFPPVYFGPEPD